MRAPAGWMGYVVAIVAVLAVTGGLTAAGPAYPLRIHSAPYLLVMFLAALYLGVGPTLAAFVVGLACLPYAISAYHEPLPSPAHISEWADVAVYLAGSGIAVYAAFASARSRTVTLRLAEQCALDLEERERTEAELRESESKYRQLFHNANDAIFLVDVPGTDMPGRFIDVNDVACRMLGYDRDELLSMGPGDVDTLDTVQRLPELLQLIRSKGHATFSIVQVTKAGEEVPVEISAHLFRFAGKDAVLAIARDISERMRAEEELRKGEERFRILFDNAADCLFMHDLEGHFVEANNAACETLGYTRDELLRLSVSDVVVDYDREALERMWAELAQSPKTVYAVHRRADGSTLPVEGNLSIVEYHGRKHILAVVRDITQRLRADEERRALREQMEEQKRSFYRDTIYSVTEGKLDVCDDCVTDSYLHGAELQVEASEAFQARDARHAAIEFCSAHGLSGDRLDGFTIGVGEAITNAIKHGADGRVYAGIRESCVWVGVADRGPGIESLILPRAVLLRGFSTKPSLGLGYSIMLDAADRVHLKTDSTGTVVVLEKSVSEDAAAGGCWSAAAVDER